MSTNTNTFYPAGSQEEQIVEAQSLAAAFWSKGIEVQQVLEDSIRSFKAFFRWLSVEIRRISNLCLVASFFLTFCGLEIMNL